MDGSDDWIGRRIAAAATMFPVPQAVTEAYRVLLADELQKPVRPDRLREIAKTLAEANAVKPDGGQQ